GFLDVLKGVGKAALGAVTHHINNLVNQQ
uniref:Cruzioseptin-10 n=1 Tax=Cruziohyla calcarifer TaxID=318249 RepID=CZS10_CRUCA|nr:RecName: Full=Cruzioseptin-10; Short=CZS-10 [Cruziohyla calcarifer]